MENEIEKYRSDSLYLCKRLINMLRENRDDADNFFGGEIYESYIHANSVVIDKARNIQSKIRNL